MPLTDYSPEQQRVAQQLALRLVTLGCRCDFTRLISGPRVTQYFFVPAITTPLAKVFSKEEDLALAIGAESLLMTRIRNEISIAVPNTVPDIINFDKSLSYLFSVHAMVLPILMGQKVTGENFCIDLAAQPHLLIGGSTGSGKSVFLSQVITSLAVQKSSKQLKFVLVDTKQMDLTLFAGLPHVVEMVDKTEQLYVVLERLLQIVRQRTEQMKGIARNISEYNSLLDEKAKLPYYILIIDELADVLSQDKELAKDERQNDAPRRKRIAESLKQLAQISRAAGIHIIAATQRPSVKILDGDIKANFPARISFKLPSNADSRVILDEEGAERLLGRGDYLYKAAGSNQVERAHSAFVRMDDIARILEQHNEIRQTFEMMRK